MSAGQVCQAGGEHHSADTVRVFHGAPVPRVLCGYHAMRERLDADARNAASRARYSGGAA